MNESKIKEFLDSWTKGVIEIGKAYQEGADFKILAEVFIEKHYAFSEEDVYISEDPAPLRDDPAPLNDDDAQKIDPAAER